MNLSHNNISQKNVKMIIVGIVIAFVTIGIIMRQFVFSSQSIKLKKKAIVLEYGELVSLNVIDYLNLDRTNKEIISDIQMDTSSIKYEDNKEYPAIGNYKILFTYKNEKINLDLEVKDTIAPTFKNLKTEIEFIKGSQPSNQEIQSLFVAEDLDEVTITIDHSKVDYTKSGVYKTTVKANDSSHNQEVKDILVNISEPSIRLDKTSAVLYVQENLILRAEVKGKESKVKFQSSDKSIVEVDEQGRVTAKKSGTAIIYAKANGLQAECQIIVKASPTGAKTFVQQDGQGNQITVVKPPKTNNQTSSESGTSGSTNQSVSSNGGYDLASAKESFQLQNKERTKQGLPVLRWNDSLYETAKIRAKEIETLFSHTRPNGGDIFDMIQISWKSAGENIGMGTPSSAVIVDMWMNSAGHRANILGDYTHAAVAKYGNHWVTIFVKQS